MPRPDRRGKMAVIAYGVKLVGIDASGSLEKSVAMARPKNSKPIT